MKLYTNDPSAGSPTETLLRLLLPLTWVGGDLSTNLHLPLFLERAVLLGICHETTYLYRGTSQYLHLPLLIFAFLFTSLPTSSFYRVFTYLSLSLHLHLPLF